MKNYITLPQPLADFVVSGVIDIVEAIPGVDFVGTVAVVSSKESCLMFDYEEYELLAAISNAMNFDNVAHDSLFPQGCVLGFVDISEPTDETYSIWQTKSGRYWRISHPKIIETPIPFEGPEMPFGTIREDKAMSRLADPVHNTLRLDISNKLFFPVNVSDFDMIQDNQLQQFDLLVDEDIINSGIFVSPDSYETVGITTVVFENKGRKLVCKVKEILSGVLVDAEGQEIIAKSAVDPEGHANERLTIILDKKLMWV